MRHGTLSLVALAILLVWAGLCIAEEGPGHICFRRIDADQDGKVTFQEFAEHYGEDKRKFKLADANGDDVLTHDEYHDFLGHGAEDKS